jgi:replication protein
LRRAVQVLDRWCESRGDDTLKGVRSCGHAASAVVGVMRSPDGSEARESGVWSCGRLWLCSVCSAAVRAKRAAELDVAAAMHEQSGGALVMLTLTVRHSRGMALADLLDALNGSWAGLRARAVHRRVTSRVLGFVKALEITDGPNGWHPHLHVLYVGRPGDDASQLVQLLDGLTTDWCELVEARLGVSPTADHGVDVRELKGAAAYLSKIGPELAMADTKGSSPFSLLEGLGGKDPRSVARWLEYARATRGRSSLVWSPGLRDHFGLGEVRASDVEAAESEREGIAGWSLVAVIPAPEHRRLVYTGAIDAVLRRFVREPAWCPSRWLPPRGIGPPGAPVRTEPPLGGRPHGRPEDR